MGEHRARSFTVEKRERPDRASSGGPTASALSVLCPHKTVHSDAVLAEWHVEEGTCTVREYKGKARKGTGEGQMACWILQAAWLGVHHHSKFKGLLR